MAHRALEGVDRSFLVLGLGFEVLFVVLDLAVTWPNHAALFRLGVEFTGSSEARMLVLLSAAEVPSLVLGSTLLAVYAVLFPALGIFLGGVVMHKSAFGRGAVVVAVLVGVTGVVAVGGPYVSTALDVAPVVNALLVMLWYLLVALRLMKPGRR